VYLQYRVAYYHNKQIILSRMSEVENTSIYIYNGVGDVPLDVTHVRIDPSVTSVPEMAFRSRQKLEVVELPEGLIRIEYNAFYGCASLKRINIPSTIEEIGGSAFENCHKLDKITLPDGLQRLSNYAFYHCESLQRINIPPRLQVINEGAFCNCESLTDIRFSEGLREIGEDAFSRCVYLVSVTLPSSLKVVGIESFEGCERLNKVHMPDTVESIQPRAFKNCNFTNFRIPPSIGNSVDISIVGGNASLVSLELPESVEQVGDKYDDTEEDYTDLSVRNVALPSECVIYTVALKNCKELGVAFPDSNNGTIREALQHRFDNLPIHKICYYQSYHDTETTMQNIRREVNPWTTKPPGQLNTTDKEQDCLGMTPLHILACSTKQNVKCFSY